MSQLPPTLFDKSKPGKIGYSYSANPYRDTPGLLNEDQVRQDIPDFPELSEVEVVRHYTGLGSLNHSVDLGFYPLGSCTMKYNPKINDRLAALPGLSAHPYAPQDTVQGNLEILDEMNSLLTRLTGMARFTLTPAAGAHGELTGMMVIRKYLEAQGNPRKIVLIPDSAHGTNPASAIFAGYEVQEIPSGPDGTLELDTLKKHLNGDVAALMITNPNTLGIFEKEICHMAEALHANGSLLYMDGANMNAFMGIVRPGDLGADVIHLNLHKTFSTPHGGGGPGSGPIGVCDRLVPFLPVPLVSKENGAYRATYFSRDGIGRVKNFYGNFLVVVRALAYLYALGRENIRKVAEDAVLNANYIRKSLEGHLHLPYSAKTLHEVIFSDHDLAVTTLDIAKGLLDFGIHPFTIYFPLIVHGAMMIEPTETESLETLDTFIQAMKEILAKAKEDPEYLKHAPYHTPVRRLDEVQAARKPVVRWRKETER